MDYLDYATTATGIPITECDTCGQRHPVTRQHCSRRHREREAMTITQFKETAMPKFRKKPVTVEARQLVGTTAEQHDVYLWIERNTQGSFDPLAETVPATGVSIDPPYGRAWRQGSIREQSGEKARGHVLVVWRRTRKAIPAHVCEVSAA